MATITEEYVSFETAKLLKEKGFDEFCHAYYEDKDNPNINLHSSKAINWNKTEFISKPTQQMAMRWLREVYNICITVYPDKEKGYEAVLYDIKDNVEIILQSFGIYGIHIFGDSYEQAVEAAIKYCLENLI